MYIDFERGARQPRERTLGARFGVGFLEGGVGREVGRVPTEIQPRIVAALAGLDLVVQRRAR